MKFLNIARALYVYETFSAMGSRYMEITASDPAFPAQVNFTGKRHQGQWNWAQAAGLRLAEYFDAKGMPKLIFHSGSDRMWEGQSMEVVAAAYDIFILDLRVEKNLEFFKKYEKKLEHKHVLVATDTSMEFKPSVYIDQICVVDADSQEMRLNGEHVHIASAYISGRKNTSYCLTGEMNLRVHSDYIVGNPADFGELHFFEDVLMDEEDMRDNDEDEDLPGGYRLEHKPMWLDDVTLEAGYVKLYYKDQLFEDEDVKKLCLAYDPSENRISYSGRNDTTATHLRAVHSNQATGDKTFFAAC